MIRTNPTPNTPKTTGDPMAPKVKPGEATARHMLAALLEEAVLYRATDPSEAAAKRCRALVRDFLTERQGEVEAAFTAERDRALAANEAYNENAPYEALLPTLLATAPEGMLTEHEPALYPADPEVIEKLKAIKARKEADT